MLFRSLTARGKHCETELLNINTMSIVTCMFLCKNIYIYIQRCKERLSHPWIFPFLHIMHAVSMWKMITGTLLHNVEASLSCNSFAILCSILTLWQIILLYHAYHLPYGRRRKICGIQPWGKHVTGFPLDAMASASGVMTKTNAS